MKTLLALILGCLCSAAVLAQTPPLSMLILNARPYGWVDAQGQPQGLYPDIAAALARDSGLAVQVSVVPFARAAALVASNEADATLMFNTAFSNGRAVEAAVVFYANQMLQLRPGLRVDGREGLQSLSIGRIIGGCQELATDTQVNWRFQDVASQESGVRMLAAARIDAFCTVAEALEDAIGKTALEDNLQGTQRLVLSARPVWLMLAPRVPEPVRKRLVASVQRLQKNGELARIFKSRLGPGYVPRFDK